MNHVCTDKDPVMGFTGCAWLYIGINWGSLWNDLIFMVIFLLPYMSHF